MLASVDNQRIAAGGFDGTGSVRVDEAGFDVPEFESLDTMAGITVQMPVNCPGERVDGVDTDDALDGEGDGTESGPAAKVGPHALAGKFRLVGGGLGFGWAVGLPDG